MDALEALETARLKAAKAKIAQQRADEVRDARDAAMAEAYRLGAKPPQIVKVTGLSPSMVRKVLASAGVLDAHDAEQETGA